jgi:hypothetical protein
MSAGAIGAAPLPPHNSGLAEVRGLAFTDRPSAGLSA